MQYFFISLITGVCLVALLLLVFFTAGKKNKRQRAADLQLVQGSGDEGLLRLYQQAESENERDGIVEFIKEKLTREKAGLAATAFDLAPAGKPIFSSAPEGEAAELPDPGGDTPRRTIQGLSGVFNSSNTAEDPTQAAVSGNTTYGHPGDTHMLALETVDWQAIENELQKRRAEEARIMAQNQQIQEVFSKIRDVEDRLTTTQQVTNNE